MWIQDKKRSNIDHSSKIERKKESWLLTLFGYISMFISTYLLTKENVENQHNFEILLLSIVEKKNQWNLFWSFQSILANISILWKTDSMKYYIWKSMKRY